MTLGPLAAKVVADFEKGVLSGPPRYLSLFDLVAVGKLEKLLHRYDLVRATRLTPAQRAQFEAEDEVPYPPERERRNLGGYFFTTYAARTVGSGGCTARLPVNPYSLRLAHPFEPLPPDLARFEPLRTEVNALIATGGIVGLTCSGGQGGLALLYTAAANPRGYQLITMYDDPAPRRVGSP